MLTKSIPEITLRQGRRTLLAPGRSFNFSADNFIKQILDYSSPVNKIKNKNINFLYF